MSDAKERNEKADWKKTETSPQIEDLGLVMRWLLPKHRAQNYALGGAFRTDSVHARSVTSQLDAQTSMRRLELRSFSLPQSSVQ